MNKEEVINLIMRNKFTKTKAVILISDFLAISRSHAETFYETEIIPRNPDQGKSNGGRRGSAITEQDEIDIRNKHKNGIPGYKLLREYQISFTRLNHILQLD